MTEPHDYERYRHGIGSTHDYKKEIEDTLRPAMEGQTRADMHDEPSHEAVDKDWVPTEFYCDKSKAHRTELWNHPRKCPKCDRSMIVDKDFSPIMWD
jgi:hypothetical protein